MFRAYDTAVAAPLPLLVTGVAGVPGYNALDYFHAKYPGQVIGIRQENNLRLIAFIEFRDKRMYVRHIVPHAEYDRLCRHYRKHAE